jgi:small subunit ribosomal protein S16
MRAIRKKFESIGDFGGLRMRLQRYGRHNDAYYSIVVAQSRFRRNGRVHDVLGAYYPRATDMATKHLNLDFSKAKAWLGLGAEPSAFVAKLLAKAGIWPSPPKSVEYAMNAAKKRQIEQERKTMT